MRRTLAVALAVLGVLGVLAPSAFAQAPAPKVTIDGFLDQTTSWSNNLSIFDMDLANKKESEWYGRSRGQFQITGEVGRVKGFLKFEQDNTWGNAAGCNGIAGGCSTTFAPFARRDGGLNTEIAGNVEMLWIYTEFPFTGPGSLLPFVPMAGTMRLGIQPFVDPTYKLAAIAVGQFGGAHVDLELMPGFTLKTTYVQIDEAQTGPHDDFQRGDDYAWIFGLEMTPMQGLTVKPVYAFYFGDGTAGAPRQGGRGGVADNSNFFPLGTHENRHTFGVDAKWQAGPFSLFPTILYQVGEREVIPGGVPGGSKKSQDLDAWFIDIRGGWRSGPLEIEGMLLYTTGNEAKDNVGDCEPGTLRPNGSTCPKVSDVNFYQAIDTYSGFAAGWGAITAIMHDYLSTIYYNAGGLNPNTAIGYDKYGRLQVGGRAFYSVTPTFKLRGVLTALWTAEEVDTKGTTLGGCAGTLVVRGDVGKCGVNPSGGKGKDDYLGTEVDFGFDWNFAPNISLYWIYGHLFAGDAWANANSGSSRNPKDVDIMSAVVRYSF
jgi:hypothetical protein